MEKFISIIIPNYNGSATIGKCLEAVFSSNYKNFEVVVVDDCSTDNSVEIIKKFPCKLVEFKTHEGASKARNAGALKSSGGILFFTDADCIVSEDTLSIANKALEEKGPDTVIGGTYTRMPYDRRFFSIFQSVFVNYSEIKKAGSPDYIATHAMAIYADTFRKSGGFPEDFLPILEDVEFSHRLCRSGYKLLMEPEMLVQHTFDFSLGKSLRNAYKKARYWIMYSIRNRDLLADSGTASSELKFNGAAYILTLLFLSLCLISGDLFFLFPIPVVLAFNIFNNRNLFAAFYKTNGLQFAVPAALYYTMLYPAAVWTGAIAGIMRYFLSYYR